VKQGNLLGGIPPWGWEWEDKTPRTKDKKDSRNRLIPDPEIIIDTYGREWTRPQLIREWCLMCDQGKSLSKIQEYMYDLGIKTPRGAPVWETSTISRLLRRRSMVYGEHVAYKHTYTKEKGSKHYYTRPDEECIVIPIPPILLNDQGEPDIALFERVQLQLEKNKQFSPRGNSDVHEALLRCGFVHCGYCGRNLIAESRINGRHYVCHKGKLTRCIFISIKAERLDKAAWEKCCEIIRNPEELRENLKKMQHGEQIPVEISGAETRLQEIEQEIISMVDMQRTSKSKTAQDRINYWLIELEKEQAALLADQQKEQAVRRQWHLAYAELEKFEAWCMSVRDRLDEATYHEKRRALEILGIQAHVFQLKANPRWKITVSPPKLSEIVNLLLQLPK
jgi:site-specific DNA recombinase